MKLKKIISLVLVFAMMVTVFSAISVSADDAATATLSFVAYNNDGAPVTGNLVAGNTYQIGVQLSDISKKAYKSAQLAIHYNSSVIEFVDESNNATDDVSEAFIERTDIYDSKTKAGYYENIAAEINTSGEYVIYALGMSKNAKDSEGKKLTLVPNDGNFEIVKFRIKAKANGKLGFAIVADVDESNPTGIIIPDPTDPDVETIVTVEPVAFRVGDVSYVSGTPKTAVFTANYAIGAKTADEVVADLTAKYATVDVTYTDDEGGTADKTASITWAAPANYNSDAAGIYEFTGAVTAPEGVNYTGAAITVKANVTVDKLKVDKDAEISVNAKAGETPVLPATIEVDLNDSSKAELAVTWAAITDTSAGTRDVEGTLTGTSNIDVNGKKAVAHLTFAAGMSETSFKTITTPSTAEVAVDAADIEAAARAALPATIYGTNSADAVVYKDVVDGWDMTTTTPAEGYKVGDVITFVPKTTGFDFGTFKVDVTVSVPAGKKDVTFDKTTVEAAYKNDAGMTAEKATGAVKLTATYTDNTKVTVEGKDIAWNAADIAKFDGKTAAVYTINGTWSDIYAHTQAIVLKVTITNSGATKIEIKNSATAVAAITSLTMNTLSAKTVYAVLTPADAVDTITWSSSNTAYATVTSTGDKTATIKTKNSSGRVTITAKTGSGVSASFTLYINGNSGGNTSVGPYKGGSTGGNSLLPSTDDDIAGEEVIKSSPFTDLEGYNWAATQIETMRLLGIVSGKTSSAFAPADNVTRAEFLAMLVRLYNFQAGSEVKEFTDVSTGDWFYETVKIASSLGIAYGYENGAFDPNAVITREDMAVFAKRALDVAGIKPDEGLTSVFEDDGEISDYAHDAVLYMSGIGVINGMGDGTFAPLATANRAQAAVVVYNLYIKK
ncbi:MAG: S-layer homology domain-containing protein [Clostridia bacterium]|nr:S-layer homology domain-containing protein [Clostridia bacterium]